MGDDFSVYIEQLELLTFFSGYPLVYSIAHLIANSRSGRIKPFSDKLRSLLPYAYALTGTLFMGLVFRELVLDNVNRSFASSNPVLILKIWGLLSILFWIRFLNRKPVYSLIHSLIFFILILKDILMRQGSGSGRDYIRNDMKIYTISFIINVISLSVLILIYFIRTKRNRNTMTNTRL